MIIKVKPTPKRNRMAVILASQYTHPCYFCGDKDTVSVDTIEVNGSIQIRHKCERHRLFGYWLGAWEV